MAEILVNGSFVGSLSPWTQEVITGNAWTWSSDRAEVTPYPTGTDLLEQSFASVKYPGDYDYAANFLTTLFEFAGPGTYDSGSILLSLYNSGVFTEQFTIGSFQSDAVADSSSGTFTTTYPFDEVKISLSFAFGSPGGTYVFLLYDVSLSSIPVSVITPSKNSPVWTYQLNDQLYYNNNKNYFDRGAYARPWPAGQLLSGYVKIDVGTSVEAQPIKCGTSDAVSGYTQGYTDLGSGVFKWWVLLPPSNIDGFYIDIYAKTGSTYHSHSIYSNLKTLTGTTGISTEKGFAFRIKETALIVSATLQLSIVTPTTLPIITKLYRADPHKLDKLTLVDTVNNSTMTGLTGNQTITLDIESRGWNIGDIAVVTLQSQDGDVRIKYRDTSGEIDPNGFYYDIVNGPSYQTQIVGVKVLAYTAAETEMLVQTNDPLIMVSYRNDNTYDFVPANIEEQTWIRGNFWQPAYPAEFEDIEILPGEFTRLRNEWNRTRQFETDYMPGYLHELFSHILGSDSVNIQGTEVIQRDAYVMDFPNRQYGLVKGKVLLTEKTSIQRNVI